MGLVLHCKLKYRVWPHAHISRLRLKIFFTPKYLPKRPHGTKFRQNPRNGGSQRLHEIENLSVKRVCYSLWIWSHHSLVIRQGYVTSSYCVIFKYSITGLMIIYCKIMKDYKCPGCFVQPHTAFGTVNSNIWTTSRPRWKAHAYKCTLPITMFAICKFLFTLLT